MRFWIFGNKKKTPAVKPIVTVPQENMRVGMEGIWWDKIHTRQSDGSITVVETAKVHNTIMDKVAQLLAGLLKNETTFTGGILYHGLGRGNSAWDTSPTPPSPDKSNTILVDEYFRKSPDLVEYIDDIGNPTSTITNRVRLKTIFDFSEANGEWIREQGVFGGDATTGLNSGHIINIIRHSRIRKEDNVKLERFIQFNIVLT